MQKPAWDLNIQNPDIKNQRHSQNTGIFITQAYSEPWYFQNSGIFRNRGIFRNLLYAEPEAYLELCQTSKMKRFTKIVNDYNYFCKF